MATCKCAVLREVLLIIAGTIALVMNQSAAAQQQARTWRVDSLVSASGDGSEWPLAYKTLQEALDEALDADPPPEFEQHQIWVAVGDLSEPGYAPSKNADPNSFNARGVTFEMQDKLAIYGGFLGNTDDTWESQLGQRDPEENETVLTGDLPHEPFVPELGDCFVGNGTPGCEDPHCMAVVCANPGLEFCCETGWDPGCAEVAYDLCSKSWYAYHVVTGDGLHNTATLDGFTIESGRADNNERDSVADADLLRGGGVFLTAPQISLPEDRSPVIARCDVKENLASEGGGAYVWSDEGGQSPRLVNCEFLGNMARVDVTGDYYGDGGALYAHGKVGITLVNSVAAGNLADRHGGGAYLSSLLSHDITNCTVAGNKADDDCAPGDGNGGGVYFEDDADAEPSAITNSIFWDNLDVLGTAVADAQIYVVLGGVPHLTLGYSDVQGGLPSNVIPGDGNMDQTPRFVNQSLGNYRLLACSPCKDVADEEALPPDYADLDLDGYKNEATPLDLDMAARVVDSPGGAPGIVLDMGAYEFVPPFCPMDCEDPPDGTVDVGDFLAILAQWGQACTSCDQVGGPGVAVGEFLGVCVTERFQRVPISTGAGDSGRWG